MAEAHQETSGSGADFDLSQFYQIFFEEAGENLDLMEQMLLNLNLEWNFSLRPFCEGRCCNIRVFGCR
jgi:uncharacterized protein YciU (UPF0263 family)